MAASKLPDINTALIKHRNDSINGFVQKNYALVKVSLASMNALLPDPYKIEVNTEKYNDLIESKDFIFCDFCKEDFVRKTIEVWEMDYTDIEQALLQERSRKVWMCPKCHKLENLIGSKFTTEKLQAPYFLKIIPSPPIRLGLRNRYTFDHEFGAWFEIAMSEIESQIGIYRGDYQAQQSSDGLDELDENETEQ